MYFSISDRLNKDETVPELMSMMHCQKRQNNVIIPPFGMAFWLLQEFHHPYCDS